MAIAVRYVESGYATSGYFGTEIQSPNDVNRGGYVASGYAAAGYALSDIEVYFQRPLADRVLLLELERRNSPATTYYISEQPFITEATDDPPTTAYSPIIGRSGLPEFRRQLNDIFDGNASTGFGSIELADGEAVARTLDVNTYDSPLAVRRGVTARMYLAAPRLFFKRSDAILLARGTVSKAGGDSDGNVTIEIVDNAATVGDVAIAVQDRPLSFGTVRNITPFLADPITRKYTVHDGRINAVTAVYDDGVTLAPAQYSVNLLDGSFTLATNPTGRVTCDVQGDAPGGVFASSTEQIITNILARGSITAPKFFAALPTGAVGYFMTQTKTVRDILTDLMLGVGGYWLSDRDGDLLFAQYPTPAAPGSARYVFTEKSLIDRVTFTDEDELYSQVRYSYRKNYTVFQSRAGASAAVADFTQRQAFEAAAVEGGLNPEFIYTTSPQLETFFDNAADAQAVAARLLSIYRIPRRRYSATVPFSTSINLGDAIQMEFNNGVVAGVIVSIIDVFDGAFPVQRIEVLA